METLKGFVEPLRNRGRRFRLAATLGIATMVAVGCYGKFPLTRAVYNANGSITEYKVVHSIITWVFIILPVYSLAMLVDFIVLNLIEFWTGDSVELSEVRQDDGTVIAIAPGEAANVAVLTITSPAGQVQTMRFVRDENLVSEVLDGNGQTIGWVIPNEDGGFDLADAERRTLQTVNREDIVKQLAARAG